MLLKFYSVVHPTASPKGPNMEREMLGTNLRPSDQPQQGRSEEMNKPLVESLSNALNNFGKVQSQSAMNSVLSWKGEEKTNKNISPNYIKWMSLIS